MFFLLAHERGYRFRFIHLRNPFYVLVRMRFGFYPWVSVIDGC